MGPGQPASREAALRCEALQLLPSFLELPEDHKRPIMEAVEAIIDTFPLSSREKRGSTQHTAYLSQLLALFDVLCGGAGHAHDVTALLDVRNRPEPKMRNSNAVWEKLLRRIGKGIQPSDGSHLTCWAPSHAGMLQFEQGKR